MINAFKKYILLFLSINFWCCEESTNPQPNYRISLIDFEDITISLDSLFTYYTLEFNVTYDHIDGLVDAGPYPISDVDVVWTSNLFFTNKETGEYAKCNNYSECQNITASQFVTDTLSLAGENNMYVNELVLSRLMVDDSLILYYDIYQNGESIDYREKNELGNYIALKLY
tara:strand:+ start:371 stop:883 length:513 start_codon:yes stop_codon:yes gene_type:complete